MTTRLKPSLSTGIGSMGPSQKSNQAPNQYEMKSIPNLFNEFNRIRKGGEKYRDKVSVCIHSKGPALILLLKIIVRSHHQLTTLRWP